MTYAPSIREHARRLRLEENLTIDEIAARLAIGRTTAYEWTRDLEIPETSRQSAARLRAAKANAAKFRKLREAAYEEGRASFDAWVDVPGFRDFVALYIAEGYKRNRNVVSVSNSDPEVVVFCARWLRRLSEKPFKCSLQYHADQSFRQLCRFWSSLLGIPADEIRFQRKSNSGNLKGRKWRCRHGVLSVTVHDTYFRSRLQAWIDCLKLRWLDSS